MARIIQMAKSTRRSTLPDDIPANNREVREFLRAFGRTKSPAAVKKTTVLRAKVPAAKPRRIRNLAEARWLAAGWASEAEAQRTQKSKVDIVDKTTPSDVDKTTGRRAETWWHNL